MRAGVDVLATAIERRDVRLVTTRRAPIALPDDVDGGEREPLATRDAADLAVLADCGTLGLAQGLVGDVQRWAVVVVAEHRGSVPSSAVDEPTELIAGRFQVLETIGRGGMGVVYRAFDRERGIEVALKTLRGITPESVLRFKQEFRALRDLRHENLVELGELFENDGVWFFTMELIRGVRFLENVRASGEDAPSSSRASLPSDVATDLIADHTLVDAPPSVAARHARERQHHRAPAPRCDVERLRAALAGLARGLGALHAAGKVHRDVKPSNILVDEAGRVVLLDFGVVAELHHAFEEKLLFGTARYMAPEQARAGVIGPEADWYAVGVLVYQALTGSVPFQELSTEQLLELKQHAAAPAPSDSVDGIPPDLDALVTNLLERDPRMRSGEADLLAWLGLEDAPRGERIFVGRRAELAALDAALDDRAPIVVEGESGIGKSTLVERFVIEARLRHRGLLVLRGRCHERERVPFNALDGVIDDLARYLSTRRDTSLARLVPEDAEALVTVFPTLQIAFPDVAPRAAEARARGFRALRDVFDRLGQRRPVVIAIDDLQWADADSTALLDELVGAPVCIVATKRPGAQTLRASRSLTLAGLARADAEDLVRMLDGTEVDAVVQESHGHPLFLRALARRHGGAMRFDDVIRQRVEILDPTARSLVAAVSIAGAPIAQSILTRSLGLTAADAAPHITALTKDQLVRVHGPRPQDAIEPFHDRIRAAVVALHDADAQRSLHHAIGRALEAAAAPADALYVRFEAAGDHERAAPYLLAAASTALAAFAFGRAAELFRRALDHAPAERRGSLHVQLALALANDGRSADAAEQYVLAAALEPDTTTQLDLLRHAAERFLMGGRVQQGLDTARALLDHVSTTLPRTRTRAIGGILWNQLRMRGRALTWTRRDRRSLPADICWSMGAGLGMVDSLLGAYFTGRAARIALAEGSPLQITRGMAGATIGAALLGRRKRAALLLDTCTRAAADDATPLSRWYLNLAQTGFAFLLDNDFAAAHDAARDLEQQWYAAGHGPAWETDVAIHFALASQQMLGRFDSLARRARVLVHDAHLRGDLFQEVTLRVRFGVRHLCTDDPTAASADVLDALAAWTTNIDTNSFGNQRMWALWSRTRIAIYAHDLTAASALADEWQALHRSLIGRVPIMKVEGDQAFGTFLLTRALAAKRANQHSTHAALCNHALQISERIALLPFPAASVPATLLRAAVAWVRDTRDDRANLPTLLRAAIAQAHATRCTPYLAFTKRRLGEVLGGDEGALLITEADAEARTAGFVNPERAAELAIPTHRFAS
jgi:eukaryotic-like serine/threonine-protein kinase